MQISPLRPRRRAVRLLVVSACLSLVLLLSSVGTAWAVNVTFPDDKLESAVRSNIGKPTGQLTDTDLARITTLTARNRKIMNLSGLQYATNMTLLDLDNNSISSLYPLANLPKLQTLRLDSNLVSDLRPLKTIPNLAYIQMNRNRISDLTPLASMPKISELRLETNRLSSLTPLANLPRIRVLYITCNRLKSVAALRNLKTLDQLDISQNLIKDVSPLAGLTNLHDLNMWDNWVANIAPLAGLPLQEADLRVNMVDLAPSSSGMSTINAWISRGATVVYRPQRVWTLTGATYKLGGGKIGGVSIWYAGKKITASSSSGTYRIRSGSTGWQRFTFAKRYYYSSSRILWARAGVTTTLNVALRPKLLTPSLSRTPTAASTVRWRTGTYARIKLAVVMTDARGRVGGAIVRLQKLSGAGTWTTVYTLKTNSRGKAAKTLKLKKGVGFWRWYAPASIGDRAKATKTQRIRIR